MTANITFPYPANANDTYTASNGVTYTYDGAKWVSSNAGGGGSGNGYTGSQGDIGFTGSTGDLGYTGSQGDIGFTGSTGDIGFTGSQGDLGYTGSQGDIGYTGSAGNDGTSVRIIGSVADASELASYDATTPVLGDGLIQEDTGHLQVWTGSGWSDVGQIKGEVGATGPMGYTGSQGATGITGYTGSAGEIGATGPIYMGIGVSDYVATSNLGSNQTLISGGLPGGGDTVVQFSKVTDPQSWWNDGSHRFQPTQPGYYNIEYSLLWDVGTGTGQVNSQIHLNGSQIFIAQNQVNTQQHLTQVGAVTIYMNGTTDYVNITGYTSSDSGSQNISGGNGTWFNASLVLQGIGATGASGPQGEMGASGPQGDMGASGNDGMRGSEWFSGATNPESSIPGIQDQDFYFNTTDNSVWQYAAGISTWYLLSNITGATGPSGPQGEMGASGPTGVPGTNGATGPIGYTGSRGDVGATGVTGYTGSHGNVGATGATGPAGNDGAPGNSGSIGYTGSVGATGTFHGVLTDNVNGNGYNISNVAQISATTTISSPVLTAITSSGQSSSDGGQLYLQNDNGQAEGVGNRIGGVFFGANTGVSAGPVNSVSIETFATQTWSVGAHGSKLLIATTANGATSRTTAVTVNQDQTVNFANNISVTGSVTGNQFTTGNIVPSVDNTYTLGTSALRWANVHIGPGTLYITDSNVSLGTTANITVQNGVLQINGVNQIQAPGIINGTSNISIADSGVITFNASGNSREMTITNGTVDALGNLRVITPGSRTAFQVVNSGLTSVYAPTTILTTQSALSLVGTSSGNVQPRTYTGTMLQITAQDGQSARVSIDAFGSGAYPSIAGRAAMGTVDAPSATKAGNILMRMTGVGYGDTGYESSIVRMDFQAAEDFSDTKAGTEIVFWATPTGTNTVANVAQITGSGLALSSSSYITFGDGSTQSTAVEQNSGSWTPTLTFSTSQGSQTYTTQLGNYVKTGKMVICNFTIVTSSDSGSGNVSITGLPFAAASGAGFHGSLMSVDFSSATTAILVGEVTGGSSGVDLYSYYNNSGPSKALQIQRTTKTDLGATFSVGGTIIYTTAV